MSSRMNVELKLTVGMRYSIVTLVFFTTYVVFQFPSTVVIRYLGPRNHLASITLAWGAVMIGEIQSALDYTYTHCTDHV